jgi:phenylacetate-CoA ligase
MLKNIIKKSPYEIKQPIKYLYYSLPAGLRYGKVYRDTIQLLKKSQWWSEQQHHDYQMRQLQNLLNYSYQYVPYYHKLFNECGFNPEKFKHFDELKKIPCLTKEIFRDNLDSLVSTQYDKNKLGYITTGGSTGVPVGFYIDEKYFNAREWAFVTSLWERVGFTNYSKVAVLRGSMVQKNLVEMSGRQLILSAFYLTDNNMGMYIEKLRKFEPDFLHVFPSAVYELADFMIRNKVKPLPSLKAILDSSESVFPYQKEKIENAFKCRMFSLYGHSERSVMAGACEKSDYFHIFNEYGFTELLCDNGSDVKEEDEIGEIVATGFTNYVTPFIRYKTADLAANTNQKCECGRSYRLFKRIEGRLQDFIITSTGRRISMSLMNTHSNILDHVRQFQFYQDDPGYCILNLVKKPNFSITVEKYIYDEVKEKLGNDIELRIRYVDEIPKTNSGKCRLIIQNLSRSYPFLDDPCSNGMSK